ncbi:MAG: nicotinate-nucleotide--dimethylbenzimidazole phosphoribosyltransferase [Pseudomonadota bacterium]
MAAPMTLDSKTIQDALDAKTKPPGALGRIETLAARIAALQGTLTPRMDTCSLFIFAADHGIAQDGVSAFPQSVTRQMVANFAGGGAAANVFADTLGVELRVVDAGVAGGPVEGPGVMDRRQGDGTRNSRLEPAMTDTQRDAALQAGDALGREAGTDAVCFGEMGIGNTSAASLVLHKLLGLPLDVLIGRGTGVDDAGLHRKRAVLEEAARRTADVLPPLKALSEYSGFEIAMMAGGMIGAARAGRLVLVDGFIATAAAAAALRHAPDIELALVFAHRSEERGHGAVLDTLSAEPLLDLGLRLGEGTGALLAWPLVRAAAAMLRDMATFESAAVSGPAGP